LRKLLQCEYLSPSPGSGLFSHFVKMCTPHSQYFYVIPGWSVPDWQLDGHHYDWGYTGQRGSSRLHTCCDGYRQRTASPEVHNMY